VLEDSVEGGGEEPGWGENVGAALAFEEEGEPEGDGCAVGWPEGGCWASEKIEAFEPLARYHGNHFHFTEECHLCWCQTRLQW